MGHRVDEDRRLVDQQLGVGYRGLGLYLTLLAGIAMLGLGIATLVPALIKR